MIHNKILYYHVIGIFNDKDNGMKMKFRSNPITMSLAICEMVGQMEDIQLTVKTSDIAAWLKVSKQTAKTYLEKLEMKGLIMHDTTKWRGDSVVYHWYLTTSARAARKQSDSFKLSYRQFLESRGINL